jgi:hypothetical protein
VGAEGRWSPSWVVATVVLVVVSLGGFGYWALTGSGHEHYEDYAVDSAYFIDGADLPLAPKPPEVRPGGASGSWRIDCGRDEQGQHNADNVVVSPGVAGGAHHLHDYVGNDSTNAFSTDQSLAAAGTTCPAGDKSTYYWPVLRIPHGDAHQTVFGRIVVPDSVVIEYEGSPDTNVVPMPRFLRANTGNPHGYTAAGVGTEHVQWTCSGSRERVGRLYPHCPAGQQVVRLFTFPSCWNGLTTDSADHKSHLVFPAADGSCRIGTFPVPRLHLEISYSVPVGAEYAIDSFPEELNHPVSDHADFINVLPDAVMAQIVGCVNSGRHCTA